MDTTQVYSIGVTDRGTRVRTSPLTNQMKKIEPPFYLYFGMQFTFLVFSKLLLYAVVGSFWTVVFGWFPDLVQYIEIKIRIHFHL